MYKMKTSQINEILDTQIISVLKSMILQSRNKGSFGKYLINNKLKDSVEAKDIAKLLHPTIAGTIKPEFIQMIQNRLESLATNGQIDKV